MFARFCLASMLCCALLHAQSSSGTIAGRVVDGSGAAVPGAEVRVVNEADKLHRALQTNNSGTFTFPDLDPGTYTVAIRLEGFKQYEKTGLHLSSSDNVSLGTVRLEVGAVTETVEVKATGAVVETASSDRSALIDSKQINELMARGRDVMSLLQILPGVVNDATGSDTLGQFATPTMDGTRSNYNALNIDGISGNTARGRTAESPINMDAIAEVKVLTNSYHGRVRHRRFGRRHQSGHQERHQQLPRRRSITTTATRRSTPIISSTIARASLASAIATTPTAPTSAVPSTFPSHFNTSKSEAVLLLFAGVSAEPESEHDLATTLCPPRWNGPAIFRRATTPKASAVRGEGSARRSVAFPNNVIPANRIDPNSSKLLSVFPLPNATNTAVTNFAYNFQIAGSEDIPVKRRSCVWTTTSRTRQEVVGRGHPGSAATTRDCTSAAINNQWGPSVVDYAQTMPNLGANFTYIISPTLINEFTFGMNLWTEQQNISADGIKAYQRATYGMNIPQNFPRTIRSALLPAMSFGGISSPAQITYDGRFPMVDDSTALSFTEAISKVFNNHLFKAGMHYEHILYNQYHQAGGNSFPGSFAFGTDSNNPLTIPATPMRTRCWGITHLHGSHQPRGLCAGNYDPRMVSAGSLESHQPPDCGCGCPVHRCDSPESQQRQRG